MQNRRYGIASLLGDGDIKTRHIEAGAITEAKLNASLDIGAIAGSKKTVTYGETIAVREWLRAALGTITHQSMTTATGQNDPLTGVGGTYEMMGVMWEPASTLTVSQITLRLSKGGSPTDNLVVELQSDSGGNPSGSVLATSAVIAGSTLTGSGVDYTFTFPTPYTATAGTYHFVLKRSGSYDGSNFYWVHGNFSGSPSESRGRYRYGGGWNTRNPGYVHTISQIDGTAGEYLKAKANTTANAKVVGIAETAGASGASGTMRGSGILSGFTGLTAGSTYYLKDDGTIGTTAGTVSMIVGKAVSTTELAVDIQET